MINKNTIKMTNSYHVYSNYLVTHNGELVTTLFSPTWDENHFLLMNSATTFDEDGTTYLSAYHYMIVQRTTSFHVVFRRIRLTNCSLVM